MVELENKDMEFLPHVLGIVSSFVGPLVIYFLTQEGGKMRKHAVKAFNWQMLMLAVFIAVGIILMFVPTLNILYTLVWVVNIIFCVIAAMKAKNKEEWDYPFSIPVLK